MAKLIFALTKEKKLAYREFLINRKDNRKWDDVILDGFQSVIVTSQREIENKKRILPNLQEVDIDIEEMERTKIPKIKESYEGEKAVFVVDQKFNDYLVTACRLENYTRAKLGLNVLSFPQFINMIANQFASQAREENLKKELQDLRKPKEKKVISQK